MNSTGNVSFLASPPPAVKAEPKKGRSVLGDISNNWSRLVSRGAKGKGGKESNVEKSGNTLQPSLNPAPSGGGEPAPEADVESPQQLPGATYVSLEDAGASPIRNALWNDENAC